MKSFSSAVGFVAALAAFAQAQWVKAPTDLTTTMGAAGIPVRYKRVPNGICETNPNVRSYAGYSDVGTNEHIFWWFFEARNADPLSAPLTVWINGGPGSSSMIGLFQENGPCRIDIDGNVVDNPYSWSNTSNMLFIDEPVTVGMSYSIPVHGYYDPATGDTITLPGNRCPAYAGGTCGTYSDPNPTLTVNATHRTAPNMWKTLQGFMGAFPSYSRDGFHFTTESYGGHYAPTMNTYFLQQNEKNIPGALKINLESVAIGNGWYDPIIQYQAYYNFTISPGNTYDLFPYKPATERRIYNALYGKGNCVDQIQRCYDTGRNDVCSAADDFCAIHVEFPLDATRDEYDIRYRAPDPFPQSFFEDYLNTPEVQQAIGAFQNYSSSSEITYEAFTNTGDDGRESMTIENIRTLLAAGIRVFIYAGDADYNCNWIGNEVVANEVGAAGFDTAGYAKIKATDGTVSGVVKQSGNFAFARIYYAGHEVPFYVPQGSLDIFQRSIDGVDIATGTIPVTSAYKTKGPAKSTFREGNGTVQYKVTPIDATYNTTTHEPNPPDNKKRTIKRRATVPFQKRFPISLGRRR